MCIACSIQRSGLNGAEKAQVSPPWPRMQHPPILSPTGVLRGGHPVLLQLAALHLTECLDEGLGVATGEEGVAVVVVKHGVVAGAVFHL